MSGLQLQGEWKQFEKKLQKLAFFDFQGLHTEIGEALLASTQNRFRKEVGPDGKKWQKSHRATADKGKTLTDTSRLKSSISYKATATGVTVGTNLIYALIMQGDNGKDIRIKAKSGKYLRFKIGGRWALKKYVTVPARPFIGISAKDLAEIKEIIQERIAEVLAK